MNPRNLNLPSPLKSRSHAVALIVSDITNPFFAEIIPAVEERLGIDGFVVFVGNSSENFLQKNSCAKHRIDLSIQIDLTQRSELTR